MFREGLRAALALAFSVAAAAAACAGESSSEQPASTLSQDAQGCWVATAQGDRDAFKFQPSNSHQALAERVPAGARIAQISVRQFNVFDTSDGADDHAIFRLANRVHVITRPAVIRQQILVREGDLFDLARLEESERILRRREFIFDAVLRPVRLCGDQVDIEVVTRDTWTLSASARFRRAGGNNRFEFAAEQENWFGTGKGLAVRRFGDGDRTGNGLIYTDPAVFGSRWEMYASLSDNSDGYRHDLSVQRPFYAVQTPWSFGFDALALDQQDRLWFRGDEVAFFQRRRDRVTVSGGRAAATDERRVRRWLLGAVFDDSRFDASDVQPLPAALADDRSYRYPFFGFESTEDRFIESRNLNFIERPEDVFVGSAWRATLGWSPRALGADRNWLALDLRYQDTLHQSAGRLWQWSASMNGFANPSGATENLNARLQSQYFQRQGARTAWVARLQTDWVSGQTDDNQILLGGETGLRGYERNYQVGDRSVLLNLEQRYYAPWHPFRLVRIALAAFTDVGRAWYADRPNGPNGGLIANVGIGVRTMSSRSNGRTVAHIDLATPLVRGPGDDVVQLLFTVRQSL